MKGLEEPPGDGGQMNWILFFFLSLKIWIKNNFFFFGHVSQHLSSPTRFEPSPWQ